MRHRRSQGRNDPSITIFAIRRHQMDRTALWQLNGIPAVPRYSRGYRPARILGATASIRHHGCRRTRCVIRAAGWALVAMAEGWAAGRSGKGVTGFSPMKKPSTRRMPSRVALRPAERWVAVGLGVAEMGFAAAEFFHQSGQVAAIPHEAQESASQMGRSHRLGEMPRSAQISARARPIGRRRISASSCASVGRSAGSGASSGSGRRTGRDGGAPAGGGHRGRRCAGGVARVCAGL